MWGLLPLGAQKPAIHPTVLGKRTQASPIPRYSEFLQLNALVLGITNGDGAEGPGGNDLAFPLIHDLAGVIAQKYGMTADGADGGIAQGYFIIGSPPPPPGHYSTRGTPAADGLSILCMASQKRPKGLLHHRSADR